MDSFSRLSELKHWRHLVTLVAEATGEVRL
jgi:hypothetical protein